MKKFALLGENISYSYSPILHKLFFEALGLEGEYVLLDGKKESEKQEFLKKNLNKIYSGEFSGFNITVPYKEEILKLLDEISPEAEEIGAVNTVVLESKKLKGYNTDYIGIVETLKKMEVNVKNQDVYIFGSGGAAKAAAVAVKKNGGIPIIVSRKIGKNGDLGISYSEFEEIGKKNERFLLGINTTPLGNINNRDSSPISRELGEKFEYIFDMNYTPNETLLMSYCKKSENGLYMLVVQGIEAEKIWHKIELAKEIYALIFNELRGKVF